MDANVFGTPNRRQPVKETNMEKLMTETKEGLPAGACFGLAEIVTSYHTAVEALHKYRLARYKSGQFVLVNDDRFKGIGMVCAYSSEIPPHKLPVRLENGNVWWYDLESIVEVVAAKDAPRLVRRMKLRWSGYRLGAVA